MQFFALAGLILLVIATAVGLKACEQMPEPAAQVAQESASPFNVVALPDGSTVIAAPGTIGAEMSAYLASGATAPRRFEPGGRGFNAWAGDPTPESQARLVAFTQLLTAYPNATAQIVGYTDNVGDPAANMKLSQDRAESVVRRLVENGISQNRLSAIGKGMADPVADNGTEDGRALNRRIAIILDPDGLK